MINIRFPNAATERRALAYLVGRFSFKTWATGETIVPDAALSALAHEGINFTVLGKATYQQIISAVRNLPAAAAQL
jgi:hypothetical protein